MMSAVFATAILSVRPFVCMSDRPSVSPAHAGIVSKRVNIG